MPNYKVTSTIEVDGEVLDKIIYVRNIDDEVEAERQAKYHFINKGVPFYGVTQIDVI